MGRKKQQVRTDLSVKLKIMHPTQSQALIKRLFFFFTLLHVTTHCSSQCGLGFDPDFDYLKELYASTNGDTWTNNSGWEVIRDSLCRPTGFDLSVAYGVNTNDLDKVIEIDLPSNNLTGILPTEQFPNSLTTIIINDNSISGTIPNGFYSAPLIDINYSNNQFTGSIPVTYFSEIEHLDFSGNGLNGEIDKIFGNYTSLKTLHLGDNDNYGSQGLGGKIPEELGSLVNLTSLTLHGNNLEGCYPTQLKNLCSAASTATVSVGNSLGNWDTFCSTDKGTCLCDDEDFAILKSLSESTTGTKWFDTVGWQPIIDFNTCPDGYDISSATGISINEFNRVDSINLRDNGLKGQLPIEWQKLAYTTYINLSKNLLDGSIPSDLGNMKRLKDLRLHQNRRSTSQGFSSSLPIYSLNFDSLEVLSVNQNSLTGGLDPDLGNKVNLRELWLADNLLEGDIPSSIGDLENLTVLRIEQNGMSGCYSPNLLNLCGQLTNFNINGGNNNFDDSWVNFCASNSGVCIDCNETTISWTGAIDDQWTTPLNWDYGCVPDEGKSVSINRGQVVIDGSALAKAKNVTIGQSNAKLTLNSGENLTITCGVDCSTTALLNFGNLVNNGTILIDSSEKTAISNGHIIMNNGIIAIDTSASIGLSNSGQLENIGTIRISNTEKQGILNSALISNNGNIEISDVWDDSAFENDDTLLNKNTGIINISNVIEKFSDGLKNGSNLDDAFLMNEGFISINEIQGSSSYGIDHSGNSIFYNSGTIYLNDLGDIGMRSEGILTNDNIIEVSNCAGEGISIRHSIFDTSSFNNSSTGMISILKCGSSLGAMRIDGPFINEGSINIDSSHMDAISVDYNSENKGQIIIDNSGGDGVDIDDATFDNRGTITILNSEENGLKTFRGGILNNHNDLIIDESKESGIKIDGTFVGDGTSLNNYGFIDISNSEDTGLDLCHEGIFTNKETGEVEISTSLEYGLHIGFNSFFYNNIGGTFKISTTTEVPLQVSTGGILEGYPTIEIID